MVSIRVQFLYDIAKLLIFAEKFKIQLIAFTFYRDPAQQLQEFIKGKSKIKTNGPHQKWTAIDFVILEENKVLFDSSKETVAKYKVLGDFWKNLGPRHIWGGDFKFSKDVYHFELQQVKK